ncbi:hypothetical protein GGS23DRAFT_253696 [Durotheca rogersii]|uniref:uncharacterized protein n=1 Tax=Durotheca rogersii TaxID=419775 RepID=UPI00221E721F|nr:uncharacterized protein GGS23DRAFT_253696 [Durotheca rogersii]KAI5859908.1 hypothetical protein GGS23DRAFT_253696 [Durotheca rogersii]
MVEEPVSSHSPFPPLPIFSFLFFFLFPLSSSHTQARWVLIIWRCLRVTYAPMCARGISHLSVCQSAPVSEAGGRNRLPTQEHTHSLSLPRPPFFFSPRARAPPRVSRPRRAAGTSDSRLPVRRRPSQRRSLQIRRRPRWHVGAGRVGIASRPVCPPRWPARAVP